MGEALSKGQVVHREDDPVDDRVPAAGASLLNGRQVPLDHALMSE